MRLFAYYAVHSVWNQIRKMFRSWVLALFIASFAGALLLGMTIGVVGTLIQGDEGEQEETVIGPEDPEGPEDDAPPAWDDPVELGETTVTFGQIVELIGGAVVLLMFVMMLYTADKSGAEIFLPADTALLFPAPMKPQSVLLFRLMNQMGVSFLASGYLLFQIPGLLRMGFNAAGIAALIVTWGLLLIGSKLIQMLAYLLASRSPEGKIWLRRGVSAFLLVLVAAFLIFQQSSSLPMLPAVFAFFCARGSRFIPLWGWLKGILLFAGEGSVWQALALFGAQLLLYALLVRVIWGIRADFYEEASINAEKVGRLLAEAQSEDGTVVVQREKDRSDKLRRDGLRHGQGASVFFHKALYNRFRFADLGFLTRPMEFYLVFAAGTALITRFAAGSDTVLPMMLVLAVCAFFRTLGNPLRQDVSQSFFLMVPEPMFAKLAWSLLAGGVNCLLDILLPAAVGLIILQGDVLTVLLWIPAIVSIDLYGSAAGSLIDAIAPSGMGKVLKQVLQVSFFYLGILPSAAVIALGLWLGLPLLASLGTFALNVLLSAGILLLESTLLG
ncbi:MAG: hypothetical protein ILP12_00150 [Lachnospiraceae bacterium]|nr:hypothetical protein [Lachnospiraceae bacterium]